MLGVMEVTVEDGDEAGGETPGRTSDGGATLGPSRHFLATQTEPAFVDVNQNLQVNRRGTETRILGQHRVQYLLSPEGTAVVSLT